MPWAIASAADDDDSRLKNESIDDSACSRDHQTSSTATPSRRPETRLAGVAGSPHVSSSSSPPARACSKQAARSCGFGVAPLIALLALADAPPGASPPDPLPPPTPAPGPAMLARPGRDGVSA